MMYPCMYTTIEIISIIIGPRDIKLHLMGFILITWLAKHPHDDTKRSPEVRMSIIDIVKNLNSSRGLFEQSSQF